jgi:CheY-like chemotaxis protein
MFILIAEDGDDARESLKMVLEIFGHEVTAVRNGLEAVRAASERTPDVILMDLGMPQMDGFEAARQIRSMPQTMSVPLIAVSAWVTVGQLRDRAEAAGYCLCLAKPIDHKLLSEALEAVSSKGGL